AVLYWGVRKWLEKEEDPLEELIDKSLPAWRRCLRWLGRAVADSFKVSLLVWLAVTPLAASRYNLVSPVGVLLGAPLAVLCSVALIAGLFLLLTGGWWVVSSPFAWTLDRSLAGCEYAVDLVDGRPLGHFYVGVIPDWWLWVFYVVLLAGLTHASLRRRWYLG